MSERGGPVHSYTVRAHHHDGSGGSERAAPNRNTPLAWRVQGVAPNEGNGQGKDRGSGSGALNHARARAGTGSARTAQKNQTRCMPDLHEWVEHGQSHGGPSVTWDSPLTHREAACHFQRTYIGGVSVPRRAPGVITRQRLGLLPRDCLSSTLPAAPAEAMLSASRASARGENVWSPQIPVTLSQPTLYTPVDDSL